MQELKSTEKKLIISMVGLPARGKTHISNKINRYLNWIGYKSQVFCIKSVATDIENIDFDMEIDPENQKIVQLRKQLAQKAQQSLVEFLQDGGDVALYNGLCHSKEERAQMTELFKASIHNFQVFWIESICEDQEVITQNIIDSKLSKVQGDQQQSIEQFKANLDALGLIYQTLDDTENSSYMKIINIGKIVRLHQVDGYLPSKVASFILNLHISHRAIYLCRSGETQFNVQQRLGGDSELTPDGQHFAEQLANFFEKELAPNKEKVNLFTSTMKRSVQTAEVIGQRLNVRPLYAKNLDEIDYGIVDGMTYKELNEKHKQDEIERQTNQLDFKFPRGESYRDVISRIEPVIFEAERAKSPVIIITHVAVLKCLYAYFHLNQIPEIPTLAIPQNCIIRLDPGAHSCQESRFFLPDQ